MKLNCLDILIIAYLEFKKNNLPDIREYYLGELEKEKAKKRKEK